MQTSLLIILYTNLKLFLHSNSLLCLLHLLCVYLWRGWDFSSPLNSGFRRKNTALSAPQLSKFCKTLKHVSLSLNATKCQNILGQHSQQHVVENVNVCFVYWKINKLNTKQRHSVREWTTNVSYIKQAWKNCVFLYVPVQNTVFILIQSKQTCILLIWIIDRQKGSNKKAVGVCRSVM